MSSAVVGCTHTIVRFRTRIRRNDGTENFGGFVDVLDGFPQRDFVLWVFMYPINISPFRLYSVPGIYHVSISRLPHRGLPRPIYTARAITPLTPLHGYHACVYLSRLPRHSSFFYSWVITPELSRSTTHVHRVITPAIVVCSLPFTGYYAACSSPPTPPPARHTYQPTPQPSCSDVGEMFEKFWFG